MTAPKAPTDPASTPPTTPADPPRSRFWYDSRVDGLMYFHKSPKLKPKVATKPKP